jgi:hypothetical protein
VEHAPCAARYRRPIGRDDHIRPERPASRVAVRTALGALLSFALFLAPAWGAEVRGRITLSNGQPAANEPILLGSTPVGRTDVAGVYWLNLPAGTHILTVRGQQISVQVSPNGNRSDIKLK